MSEALGLANFLLARIAEDEAVARSTQASYEPLEWTDEGMPDAVGLAGPVDGPSGYTSVVIDPARVLAECAAKRAIVEYATGRHTSSPEGWEIVQMMAAIYAEHPDYRDEWRP